MNNEQQQIIDEAYENYSREYEKDNSIEVFLPVARVDGKHTYRKIDEERFIGLCIYDETFSQKWGLNIEKRELSLDERKKLYEKEFTDGVEVQNDEWLESKLRTRSIPTRITEITYKDKTIPSYE